MVRTQRSQLVYALGSNAVICLRDKRVVGSRGLSSVCMPSRRLEQPIVAVAIAEDPACVDMVDGRLIETCTFDDARRVLAWANAITEHATHRLTLYGGKPMLCPRQPAPRDPMSLAEAQAFVRSLLEKWVASK